MLVESVKGVMDTTRFDMGARAAVISQALGTFDLWH